VKKMMNDIIEATILNVKFIGEDVLVYTPERKTKNIVYSKALQ
jgi:hypothetical protein